MMRTAVLFCAAAVGCGGTGSDGGGDGSALELPRIVPPVKAATPAGLQGATARTALRVADELSATDFRDRFFNPAGGPTEVFQILAAVDDRLAELTDPSSGSGHDCIDQVPVDYTVSVFGQDVSFAGQCYRRFDGPSGPPAFMQVGQRDGETFLYVTGGATRVAARIASDSTVDVWYGVGYTNDMCGSDGTFDGCSYAVTQIHADPSTHAFEMTVAGIGVGFCGVHIASDGTSIIGEGSEDMGTTCHDVGSLCVAAADLSPASSCDAIAPFALPALGRQAGAGAHDFGASMYPETPNITLDGTATDSLGFGPTAPTPGVGNFD